MTIYYSDTIVNQRRRNWVRLLARWKASLYKLVWPDLVLYFGVYFLLSFYYREILHENDDKKVQKEYFMTIVKYCRNYANNLPLTLVLGFYVSIIVSRWWKEFQMIPWPDSVALQITTMVDGRDDRGIAYRRTMIRYTNLSWIFLMGMISPQVKLRFPTLDHFVKAGLLLPHEKMLLETYNVQSSCPKYWVPITWAINMAARARREGRIGDNISLNLLVATMSEYRIKLGDLLNHDWVQIPLVYTQSIAFATYSYFLANVMGKQFLKQAGEIDLYVPIFHFFEFFFYMGWMKVAESLINPFGNDDDDFELNYFIDRNFQTGYFIVDDLHYEVPLLAKDPFWNCYSPDEIPYPNEHVDTADCKTRIYHGPAARRILRMAEDQYVSRSFRKRRKRDTEPDDEYVIEKKRERKKKLIEERKEARFQARDAFELDFGIPEDMGAVVGDHLKRSAHYHTPMAKMPKKDIFNRVSLLYKTLSERKKQGSLQTNGYWASITGPVLADSAFFYETEFHKQFVRKDQPTVLMDPDTDIKFTK